MKCLTDPLLRTSVCVPAVLNVSILPENVVYSSFFMFLEVRGRHLYAVVTTAKACAFEEAQPLMMVKCLDVNACGGRSERGSVLMMKEVRRVVTGCLSMDRSNHNILS